MQVMRGPTFLRTTVPVTVQNRYIILAKIVIGRADDK